MHPNTLSEFNLLTLTEVARLLHVSRAHVTNAVAGRVRGCFPIPTISIGRRKLVRRETLVQWIEQNEHANDNLESSPERGRRNA